MNGRARTIRVVAALGLILVVRALIRLVIDARQQRQVPRTFGSAVEVSMGYGIGSQRIHSLDPERWKPFGEAR